MRALLEPGSSPTVLGCYVSAADLKCRAMTSQDKTRALTGIKPTGIVHWGHYFGMIQPAIALSQEMDAYYFLADYHALTSVRAHAAERCLSLLFL